MNRRGFLGGLFAAGVLAVHMKLGNLAPIPEAIKEEWDPNEAVEVIEVWNHGGPGGHRVYWVDRHGFVHLLDSSKGPAPFIVLGPMKEHPDLERMTRRLYAKES